MDMNNGKSFLVTALVLLAVCMITPAMAATTQVQVVKYANDDTTIIDQVTVNYTWMAANLPVLGDGTTHYYHQGPVFVDDANETLEQELRWNPEEDTNVLEKDMGAVKGTNVRDLCDLVGGMSPGEEVKILSSDGFTKWFAYENVYGYSSREGPIGLCWYMNGNYPDSGYSDGMRLVWFADDSVNTLGPGGTGVHAFGNYDWYEAADEAYWYYYISGSEHYPTTTGLSSKYVNRIYIYSDEEPPVVPTAAFTADVTSGTAPLTVQFTDQSTGGGITAWAWDFENDGTVDSTDQSPSHVYEIAGNYTVSLTVTNAAGSDDEVKTDYITVTSSAQTTWYVDDDGGADFTTIQAAIDAALPGDTVVVKDGYYIENVDISKQITLRSEHGAESTVIETVNMMSIDSLIDVTADYVTITGFTLTKADVGGSGIYLIDSDYCTITDTVSETNGWGIRLRNSTHNVIRNTTNIDCYRGIALYGGSNENLIDGNEVSWNADYGIWLEGSHANTIVRNNASGAEGGGAFNLRASNDNIIHDNVLDCYEPEGAYGVTLEWGSLNNSIYLNNFKNTFHPTTGDATGNLWVSPDPVEYTYQSTSYTHLIGNYWDAYSGADGDGDGIGDTPYTVSATLGTDDYPLMGEWHDGGIMSSGQLPIAAFTSNVQSGTAPLTVNFTDQSAGDGIADWAWDFENDGIIDNITQNATHTYTTACSYTVNLTVTNATGSDSEVKADYITVTEPVLPVLNVNTGIRYATIQGAVTAATAGDELVVGNGSYTENVDVDKQLVIRSENGSTSVTVTAASPTLPVFDVNANAVTIDGFTVCGPTNEHVAGIEIVDFNDCRVAGNDCSGCYNGIHIGGTGMNNTVEENSCHGNTRRGISVLDTAHDNYILKNIVEANTDAGICIKDSAVDNVLWLNDVISNRVEILTANTAHSPGPITYLYNGGTYTGCLGNYYSEYSGTDPDGDGVGAPSYSYGTGGDDYPLMARSANYVETELPPAPELIWGPYLTGTTSTGTVVNVKTDIPTTVTVEYATDAYYTAQSGYDQDATDGASTQLHHVPLAGLSPDTLYHYRVVYDGIATGDFHFRTFPENGPFTFVMYSDTQDQLPTFSQLERHKLVADRIAEELDVAFVLNSGDLVNNAANISDWDRYFAAGRLMMANVTVYPALGNHDANDTNYYQAYGLPEYYSFDCGAAHIAVLDSNDWAWPEFPTQSAWLAQDLQTEKPFKFVSFHHPPYTSERNHFGGYENIRDEWEDEFNDNNVLAVFNGHVHAYERFLVNNTTYFVAGTGGGPAYNLASPRADYSQNSLEYVLAYIRVTLDPVAGTATAQVIRVADVSSDLRNITTMYPPDTVFETVVMNLEGLPVADFTVDVSSGDAPLTVQFIDQSTGDGITNWAWDFENDGTVDSTEQNPSHVYSTAGTCTVSLTVTNAAGSDSEVKTDYITVTEPSQGDQEVYLSPSSLPVVNGTTAEYEVRVSSLPDGLAGYDLMVALDNPSIAEIVGVQYPGWAVLNNTTPQPPGDSLQLSGVDVGRLVEPGAGSTLLATITVRADTTGTSGISISTVNMDADGGALITPAAVTPGEIIVYVPMAADFSANVTSGRASFTRPLVVAFTDLSTGVPPGSLWSWDFDNNGVVDSTLQNPVTSFTAPGNYTVNLTVQNAYSSDTAIKADYIQVTSYVKPFPGQTNEPTDPDGDNLYEDINGNGRLDYDDVVIYYENMQWIRDQADVGIEPYDYNQNGRIDYDDVVLLYWEILETP